jgi:hypothetical protein
MAIIVLYGVIVMRGLRTALTSNDPFSKLLAAGLSFVFALQVFAIIGGVTRLLPLTGLTTPFVSQGGSSLVANYAMMALLIVVTHRVRMPQAQTNEPLQSLAHDTTQVIAVPSRPDAAATDPRPAPTPSQSPSSADEPTQAVPVGAGPSGTGDELTQALPTGSPDAEPTQAIPSGTAQTWNPDDTNPQGRLP